MSKDTSRYQKWQKEKQRTWEAKCLRCGACCGSVDGDPCVHLRQLPNGRYSCTVYKNRFGLRKTVSGKTFECVPIRSILKESWPGDECCGYKKKEV